MNLNDLIDRLEGIRDAEGGNIQVFLNVGDQDTSAVQLHVGRAEHWVDEHVSQGLCEDYHQCVVIGGH